MTETLYKWLLADGTTPVQNKTWPVHVGEWTPEETPVLCRRGWHGMLAKDVLAHLPKESRPPRLWIVETNGTVLHGDDKFACSSMRLARPVGEATTGVLVRFALVCAESSLANYETVFPGDTRIRDCIDVSWRFLRGAATRDELSAAWIAGESAARAAESARSAACAAWSAAHAASAARSAERAAWSAAWSAESAAWSAAWNARRTARAAWSEQQSALLIVMIEEVNK
jgi:hypothetical protein